MSDQRQIKDLFEIVLVTLFCQRASLCPSPNTAAWPSPGTFSFNSAAFHLFTFGHHLPLFYISLDRVPPSLSFPLYPLIHRPLDPSNERLSYPRCTLSQFSCSRFPSLPLQAIPIRIIAGTGRLVVQTTRAVELPSSWRTIIQARTSLSTSRPSLPHYLSECVTFLQRLDFLRCAGSYQRRRQLPISIRCGQGRSCLCSVRQHNGAGSG